MIERHFQHLRNGHVHLVRPSQQVRQVFHRRSNRFRAQQPPRRLVGIHAQHPFVHQHHAAAPLVAERHLPDNHIALKTLAILRLQRGKTRAHRCDLRMGEHHAQQAAA